MESAWPGAAERIAVDTVLHRCQQEVDEGATSERGETPELQNSESSISYGARPTCLNVEHKRIPYTVTSVPAR